MMPGTWRLLERECMKKDVYSRRIVDMIVDIMHYIIVKRNQAEREGSSLIKSVLSQ